MESLSESATVRSGGCPQCGGPLDVHTPHVIIDGSTVRAFCSADCVTRSTEATSESDAPAPAAPGNRWLGRLVRAGVGLPFLALSSFGGSPIPAPQSRSPLHAIATPQPPLADEPTFGPAWPPTDQEWQAEISSDSWIHPLDGPRRRMPISDSRVFGAERSGERPGECNNGHCGVDLSGPWGEPVHAAHDGVVDRVQRGANEDHGGLYLRLSHHNGTIFTQYFHLAAIPRRLEPGTHVKVGEVIGLVGDTGVKHSEPHLHFTISVRPGAEVSERYIDPEPLIALWPLRIPIDDVVGMPTIEAAPGVPHGAANKRRPAKRDLAEAPTTTASVAAE